MRLCKDVEKSNLVHYTIGTVESEEQARALITSIPRMRVTTLEILVKGVHRHVKADLIRAVKQNACLRAVVGVVDPNDIECLEDLFNQIDRIALSAYAERNKCRAQWIANPSIVPKGAWASAISSAYVTSTGPDTTFSIVQSLAPFIAIRFKPPPHDGSAHGLADGCHLEPPLSSRLAVRRPIEPFGGDVPTVQNKRRGARRSRIRRGLSSFRKHSGGVIFQVC